MRFWVLILICSMLFLSLAGCGRDDDYTNQGGILITQNPKFVPAEIGTATIKDQQTNIPFDVNFYLWTLRAGVYYQVRLDKDITLNVSLVKDSDKDSPAETLLSGNITIPAGQLSATWHITYPTPVNAAHIVASVQQSDADYFKTNEHSYTYEYDNGFIKIFKSVLAWLIGIFDDLFGNSSFQKCMTGTYLSNSFAIKVPQPDHFIIKAYAADAQGNKTATPLTPSSVYPAGKPFYVEVSAYDAAGKPFANYNFQNEDVKKLYWADSSGKNPGLLKILDNRFQGNIAGVGYVKVQFNDVGTIKLGYAKDSNVTVISDSIGRFVPDHFAVKSAPALTLSGGNWGYIGENMQLTAILEAQTQDGLPTPSYQGSGNFNLNLDVGTTYNPRLTVNTPLIDPSPGNGQFKVTANVVLNFKKDKDNRPNYQDIVQGLSGSIKPTDGDGVTTSAPVALSGSYTLYGGRIHVLGGHFNQRQVAVNVRVEKWDGQRFVLSNGDSQTVINYERLPVDLVNVDEPSQHLSADAGTLAFNGGSASLQLYYTGKGNTAWTLNFASNAIPGYFSFLSDNLSWGPIVDGQAGNPAAPGNGRVIWEKEILTNGN